MRAERINGCQIPSTTIRKTVTFTVQTVFLVAIQICTKSSCLPTRPIVVVLSTSASPKRDQINVSAMVEAGRSSQKKRAESRAQREAQGKGGKTEKAATEADAVRASI